MMKQDQNRIIVLQQESSFYFRSVLDMDSRLNAQIRSAIKSFPIESCCHKKENYLNNLYKIYSSILQHNFKASPLGAKRNLK